MPTTDPAIKTYSDLTFIGFINTNIWISRGGFYQQSQPNTNNLVNPPPPNGILKCTSFKIQGAGFALIICISQINLEPNPP